MVRCLLRAGHGVRVWNRSPGPVQALVAEGAIACASPRELADQCAWVALCLFDAHAVEAVVFGERGLAESSRLAILIDHSTIPPDATREFSARLARAGEAVWLDAPVSGGTAGAAAGTLAVMAGGPPEPLAAVTPLLMAYAQRVTPMGPVGAGQVAKLCNQAIVATTIAAIAESVALARDAGVDAARLPEALAGGWADSTLLQGFVPRMLAQSAPPPGATLDTILKDVDAVAALAQRQGNAMPVAVAAGQGYRLASRHGMGAQDASQLIRLYDRRDPA